ncbi:amidohydrolase family protein [Lachnoclostridium pacaense]|uniref:adenine deaminase C-terminal domain-containing protein n=1 Tax=Enterocloster hominis (ex Hitch et al. 2024) TaxID=1917870 RepID=UPI001D0F9559|nr:adenine deaminase C-terminal domain-containing protein [Lachnoclostridium pacaense]MCC2875349.1 amidohydrolase family protein [Lachnoclostridium pacaense]
MKVDFVVKGAWVFMTYRQCFEKRDVAVAGEKIYAVSPAICYPDVTTIDGSGMYMIPGLVDIHMHIESSMTYPAEFSRITLLYGVTTVVADAHEIANVFGMDGIRWFMGQETKLDIFYAIPSSVPATNDSLETSGAGIGEAQVRELARDSRVLCLGEVMNFKDLTSDGDALIKRLVGICKGKDIRGSMRIEGHCPKISGEDLCRFIYEGVDADHTQQTPGSVLEKTDMGMFLELQHKSLTPEVVDTVCRYGLYENVALITDDTMPDQLLKGQLNRIVAHAVKNGMPVEKAIYCATFTPARRMHLDDRGMIGPGKLADFVLLRDLEHFQPAAVFKRGELVYGERLGTDYASIPEAFYHSVNCNRAMEEDFRLKTDKPCSRVKVNVMKIQTQGTFTSRVIRELDVKDGVICWKEAGLSLAVMFERYGKNGNISFGLVEGALRKPGAIATTWSHDSHNLLVLGTCELDMAAAQNRVIELQGGYVAAEHGCVTAEARLPVGGILYDGPVEELASDLGRVRQVMRELGYENNNEIMSMSTLGLPVSPELKLTDYGLLDVRSQEPRPLIEAYIE